MKTVLAALALTALGAAPALAQSTATAGPLPVTGNVPALCSAGTVTGGDQVFGLGVMIDTSTGFMLNNLAAPNKVVTGSFCNFRSTISIAAAPMTAQAATGAPPAGFANAVNFTATASGWTTTAASTTTGAVSNPAASQSRLTAFAGDITVGVSGFSPVGGTGLRLVSDPSYRGTVTVTLAVAN